MRDEARREFGSGVGTRPTILVADDEAQVVQIVRGALRVFPAYRVESFADGRLALDFYEANAVSVALLICDWRMPRMDGLAVLDQIRRSGATVPFIMLTAQATEQAVRAAVRVGADDYIVKPFRISDLRRKVAKFLPAKQPSPAAARTRDW